MTKKRGAQFEWEGEATMTKFTEDKKMTKLSAAHRGDKNPFFGRKHSAATRAKMSAAHRGDKHHYFGKKLSAAHRAKISAAVSAALLGNKNFLGHRPASPVGPRCVPRRSARSATFAGVL
jgi:hypothetical protein